MSQKYNNKVPCIPFYLGADPDYTVKLIKKSKIKVPNNLNVKICYGGSLGYSYDFNTILKTFKELYSRFKNIELYFIGGGIKEKEIIKFGKDYSLPIFLTGYLSYPDYLKYLCSMDIALNSFKKDSAVAFSYKFNDYISVGLAIVNNLTGETAQIVEENNIGFNFDYKKNSLELQLEKLITNKILLSTMKENSYKLSLGSLNSKSIYNKMTKEIID